MLDDDAGHGKGLGVANDGVVVALDTVVVGVGVVGLGAAVGEAQGHEPLLDGLGEFLAVGGDGGVPGVVAGIPDLHAVGARGVGGVDVDAHEDGGAGCGRILDAALEALGLDVVAVGVVGAVARVTARHIHGDAGVGLELVAAGLGNREVEVLLIQAVAGGARRLVVVPGVEGDDEAGGGALRRGLVVGRGHEGVSHGVLGSAGREGLVKAARLHKLAVVADGVGGDGVVGVGGLGGRAHLERIGGLAPGEVDRRRSAVGIRERKADERRGTLGKQGGVDVEEHARTVAGGGIHRDLAVGGLERQARGTHLGGPVAQEDGDLLGLTLLDAGLGDVDEGQRVLGRERGGLSGRRVLGGLGVDCVLLAVGLGRCGLGALRVLSALRGGVAGRVSVGLSPGVGTGVLGGLFGVLGSLVGVGGTVILRIVAGRVCLVDRACLVGLVGLTLVGGILPRPLVLGRAVLGRLLRPLGGNGGHGGFLCKGPGGGHVARHNHRPAQKT